MSHITEKLLSYSPNSGYSKVMREAADEIERLNNLLLEIGNKAHDASTGPAVPDALWEIRSMAYQQ